MSRTSISPEIILLSLLHDVLRTCMLYIPKFLSALRALGALRAKKFGMLYELNISCVKYFGLLCMCLACLTCPTNQQFWRALCSLGAPCPTNVGVSYMI